MLGDDISRAILHQGLIRLEQGDIDSSVSHLVDVIQRAAQNMVKLPGKAKHNTGKSRRGHAAWWDDECDQHGLPGVFDVSGTADHMQTYNIILMQKLCFEMFADIKKQFTGVINFKNFEIYADTETTSGTKSDRSITKHESLVIIYLQMNGINILKMCSM